jgi:phosphatidylinositol alpha-1,6-mannosyltransferase
MRLLVFTTQFPPNVGGVETMTWQLSRHLQEAGAAVTVLAPYVRDCEKFDRTESLPIKRYVLADAQTGTAKLRQKADLASILTRTVRDIGVDCILCTGWDPCAYVASQARSRIPYFLVAHGMELLQLPARFPQRAAKAWLRKRALHHAARIFAVSQFTRDRLIELGVKASRISVIPNGVTVNGNRPLSSRRPVLATVARLVPRKGHETVLRAMPSVLEKVPDAVYRIIGGGPELQRLQSIAKELGLNGSVEFCGQVADSERERLLEECGVFVFATGATTTDFEGLGIAVLEAMQKGKPVVVTRAGGVPELVEQGRTGLIVEPDDVSALSAAISELLIDSARAEAMGREAELVVRDCYDWRLIAERYRNEIAKSLN